MTRFDVFGIGNALMDFLIQVQPGELAKFNLEKGRFHMIDEQQSRELLKKLKHFDMKLAPGGSSANTLYGVSLLGGSVVFCGKVGRDEHGAIYEQKLGERKIKASLGKSNLITGHAITFITPDTERTFATHLGAAIELEDEDVFYEDLENSKILHIEGYQLENPRLRSVISKAMAHAKKNDVLISVDVADGGVIERNFKHVTGIIEKYADIVFANEDEAKALTGKEPEKAVRAIADIADIAVVKLGEQGSLIQKGDILLRARPYEAKALDTTGAGDLYAAGFLYGLTHQLTLGQSSRLGSYMGARVVEQFGARIEELDQKEIQRIKTS